MVSHLRIRVFAIVAQPAAAFIRSDYGIGAAAGRTPRSRLYVLPRTGSVAGKCHVWAARTVDDRVALLTGGHAGRRRADGTFTPRPVHALVDERLRAYATAATSFGDARPS